MNAVSAMTDLTRLAGTWKLDPQKTSITFQTRAMWIFTVKGTVQAFSGDAVITPDGEARGTLVINAASFDTKNTKRDDHLRDADFFDAATYPTIVFEATSARPGWAGLEVNGTLTIRGRAKPITLHAEISGSPDSATVTTSIEVDRSLWGITWGAKMGAALKNQVTITAHFDRA